MPRSGSAAYLLKQGILSSKTKNITMISHVFINLVSFQKVFKR
jgi:hypothetical protein